MRNLKKVLSLVLCMAMMLSVMVVGAGAAFKDQNKIVNTEAVDMCVALNIINGRTDGSFDPAGNVTRAEMAKMICIVLNGGKEPATATKAVPTYADIDGHWAEGYIEYCSAKGVVAGVGGGNFNPNGSVTGSQAAKMLLVALGYNADVEKMVGGNWELYTNVLANQDGLYNDLESMDPSAALSRDNAAQMIWNALNAETIEVTSSIDRNDGSIVDSYSKSGDDMLKVEYGAKSWTGTLDSYNDKQEAVFVGKDKPDFEAYTKDDSDLIGKTVKVIYKVKDNDKDPIYGLFLDDENTYIDTIVGNIEKVDADTIKVDGTKYDYAKSYTTEWTDTYSAQPVTVKLDKDGDVIAITKDADFDFGKVAFVGAKSVQVTDVVASPFNDLEKVEMYDGMAKDDYIVTDKNDYTNKTIFTKIEMATGKVDVVNTTKNEVTIDGTVYTVAADGFQMTIAGLDLGNTVEFVAIDGYIYYAAKVAGIASLDEIVYISGAKVDNDYGTESVIAKATFVDGTAAEINVVETPDYQDTDKDTNDSEKKIIKAIEDEGNAVIDGMYAFDLDDSEYTLKKITSGSDTADFEVAEGTTATAGDDKISGMRVADDAVVFVVDKDGKVAVKTGADVAAWAKTDVKTVNAFANKTNGVAYVELAAVVMGNTQDTPDANVDAVYGYVTAVLGQTKEDGTYYNSYTVWTDDGEQTFKVKKANDFGAAKADFVKFENGKLTKAGGADAALTGMVEKTVFFNGGETEYVITDDTQIIYINVEDVAGAEGALQLATDLDGKTGDELNVNFLAKEKPNNDGTIDLLFIFADVNNDIKNIIE